MAYSKARRLAEIVSDTSGNLSVEGIIVPTQSNSDNDTSAASTAFVHAHVNALVDSAPGTLNTLNELAAALNDQANFGSTITTAVNAKLPLAGGTLTGALTTNGIINTGTSHNLAISTPNAVRINIDSNNSATGESFIVGKDQTAVNQDNILFKVQENGRVAIGNFSDPDADLEVRTTTVVSGASDTVNSILIGLQSANRPSIMLDTADTTYTNRTWNITNVGSAGSLFIGRNGLDAMVMKNDGKVGIGQSAPAYLLEVGDDGATAGNVRIAGGGDLRLSSATGTTAATGDTVFYNDANSLHIAVGTTTAAKFKMDSVGNVGIGDMSVSAVSSGATTLSVKATANGKGGAIRLLSANDTISAYMYPDSTGFSINTNSSVSGARNDIYFRTAAVERLRINTAGSLIQNSASSTPLSLQLASANGNCDITLQSANSDTLTRLRNGTNNFQIITKADHTFTQDSGGWLLDKNGSDYGLTLKSASTRSGLVIKTPGTNNITASALVLADTSFRLGTASYYHIHMLQDGKTKFGNSTNNSYFNSNGDQFFNHGGYIGFESADNDYSTVFGSVGYASQSYSTSQRYWNHISSKGGTHITLNTDSGDAAAAENAMDDFVIWQGVQDSGEPRFRVSNSGRVTAKHKYEIGNHKTNKEEFGVSAVNGTADDATNNINTTASSYENRSGVYWLHYNSKKFRGFVRPNWMQGRNWVLAAKFFSHDDMPAGSVLWQNDASWNGGDFDLNNGHFSKYGNIWRYFGFNRLAMQMGNRVAPIMQFNSTQTLYGAFSGGLANNGGVTADSTDPSLGTSTTLTYHTMTNYIGPNFVDLGGAEDRMQPYGLNKWLGVSSNSNSSNNQGSGNVHANVSKGFQLTVEDNHPAITGIDSNSRAGAWIGCAMDEGASNQANATGITGADSAFGFGGACGNTARTWTSGYAEWARGNEVANLLPGYIWLSID